MATAPAYTVRNDGISGLGIEAARGAGFDGYLTKPLDVVRLLEEVDRRLARAAPGPGEGSAP